MMITHQSINLFGKPLLTLVTTQNPVDEPVPLPSEACFAYILEGASSFQLSASENINIAPGQIILSLCGKTVGHMLGQQQQTGQVSSIVVHFHKEQLKKVYEDSKPPFWKELDTPVTKYVVQVATSRLVEQYFAGVKYLFEYEEAVTEDILILKLKEIILLLLQTKNSSQVTQIMRSLFSERTFSFKEVIEAHICESVSLETLAQLTNHSLSSFKRTFKKIYDTTPSVYIMSKRAEKVAGLLKLSDESVSNIGYQCGFNSPAHLSRVFKDKYGVTPTEYRLNFSDK